MVSIENVMYCRHMYIVHHVMGRSCGTSYEVGGGGAGLNELSLWKSKGERELKRIGFT